MAEKKDGKYVGRSEEEVLRELTAAKQKAEEYIEKEEDVASSDPTDPMNEEIVPGGPTYREVEELKAKFGEIYATEFDDEIFLWRTLSRVEYKDILKLQRADAMYKEERICEKCVVWPEGYDFVQMAQGKAGIPSVLAEQIMDRSGFSPNGEAKKL